MIGAVRAVFALARALGSDRSSNLGGAIARAFGPLLPQHRTALDNLRAAFPHKPDADIKVIARGAWDNLGRVGAEYAHLATLFDFDDRNPNAGRCEVHGIEHFLALRDDGKPGIIFAAHL
ncbi:MAG TPA: lipid A biosynthesis lauroyl acyltransferase, partial [Alphaproteobacteria bacterium]|nr:lipid A biosynthesis lauroyl acyltransferase [Alphaproteobacteria bacterium]